MNLTSLIGTWIFPGAKVLDLGCGSGELLAALKEHKNIEARGVELNPELVQKAVKRGVPVYQGDIEQSLRDYPDGAFDYVVLSQTLQEIRQPVPILNEMMRVGKQVVVAFPNFGHWRVRLSHLLSGRAPKTTLFPYEWYESPNIHFLTVIDFEELIARERWRVEQRTFLAGDRPVSSLPNLTAEVAVYLIKAP